MKKHTLKAIGFLMTLVLLFSLTTAYPTMSAEELALDTEQLISGELEASDASQEPSLPNAIPTELISDEKIQEAGHVRRLPQAEGDMNTVMLANEDGTHSMYLFSYPVKYTDENGNVYDKSNRLTAHSKSGYAYVNEENDIQTHLPTDITKNPVMLTYGDYTVATYIVTESLRSVAQLQNENTVLYPGAFGADTAVRYTTNFSGYKEDVILYSEAAPTTVTFLLRPSGLVPVAENGVIRYQDKDTGETVLTTSPFYIYDSSETPNSYFDTDFTLESPMDGIYVLTVTLDADYMATEGLTYPIYVDPTVSYVSNGDVETVTVYSGSTKSNDACGNEMVQYVGYRDGTYSQGRMLVRINALKNNLIFRSLTAEQVTSVTLNLYSAGGGSSATTLHMYQFSGNAAWTPAEATWHNVSASSFTVPYASASLGTNVGFCSLDITNIAEGWLGVDNAVATSRASQGILLINGNSIYPEYSRSFYGSNSGPGFFPTVTVTYTPVIEDGTYFVRNAGTQQLLEVNSSATTSTTDVEVSDFDSDDAYKWIITLQSNGYYVIQSVGNSQYLGIPNSDREGTESVSQYTSKGRGTQWAIIPIGNDSYTLMANPVASNSNGEITKVLSLPTETSKDCSVSQQMYSEASAKDNWELIPNIYGDQAFRDLSEEMYDQVNCMGYALGINDVLDIREYFGFTDAIHAWAFWDYYSNNHPTYTYGRDIYDATGVTEISWLSYHMFEEWLEFREMDDVVVSENEFVENGENNPLEDNQYRIVFRVGYMYDENGDIQYDFHFWYQLYDGTWANKHGHISYAVSRPVHLPSNETPFSENSSGWDLCININATTGEAEETMYNFYDGVIFSFIVTTS